MPDNILLLSKISSRICSRSGYNYTNPNTGEIAPFDFVNVKDHVVCDIEKIIGMLLVRALQNTPSNSTQVQESLLKNVLVAALHICEDREITTCVNDYCKSINGEHDRYALFISLANTILSRFWKNMLFKNRVVDLGLKPVDPDNSFLFHRNDPAEINTSHNELTTTQKPHIIGTTSQTTTAALNRNVQTKVERCFEWHHILSFAEFELRTKGAIEQPSSYNIELQKRIPANKIEVNGQFCGKGAYKEVKRRVYNDGKSYGFIPRAHAVRSMNNALPNETKTTAIEENPTKKTAADEKIRKRKKPAEIRAAMYATEMIRQRSYNNVAWVWWYDHQGAIQSTGLDIIQDLPYFVALLCAFQHFDREDWGTSPDPRAPEAFGCLDNDDGFHFIFPDGLNATMHHNNTLHERYILLGRSTTTPEDMVKIDNEPFKLKISWPGAARDSEVDITSKGGLTKNSNVVNHIPILQNGLDHTFSTGKIRSKPITADERTKSTPRILRMLLEVLLVPTETLEPNLFVTAWVDCYRCHYLFWEQGIKDGDISAANLMWNLESQCGILNDFDLATTPDRAWPGDTKRKGAAPFMALALLRKEYFEGQIVREYQHDLESFIWILARVAFLDNQGQENFWQIWNTPDIAMSKIMKRALLCAVVYDPEEFPYEGDGKGEGLWALAVSLLEYLLALMKETKGNKLSPKVIFTEFEKQVGGAWTWKNIPFKPML